MYLIHILTSIFCINTFSAGFQAQPSGKRVLMIVTSHDRMGNTNRKTGYWMEELAVPYRLFEQKGINVQIASPRGGRPPIDPESMKDVPQSVKDFLADANAQAKLDQTLKLDNVSEAYDAYFVVGGHGVMWDMANNPASLNLLSRAYENAKVVAAVCHGPSALVSVYLPDGTPLVKGKKVTGFSNEEEAGAGLEKIVPFSLESQLKAKGGNYERGPMWKPYAVRDGRLVTGQNPASSELTAIKTIEALTQD